ncbi:peroxide stress protein YaaA [Yimella sp. cx-573]|nr:peroxide stress protein YaaA [Yimella sp. cx-573]
MLVLLPPSESKTPRSRGKVYEPSSVSAPELADARATVIDAVATVSDSPDAARVLGVSPNLGEEIARNTRLLTAPAVPVSALYTGVLYDALDLPSLDAAASRRANRWLLVQSALFGALRMKDKVPPYRLSMAVNLPDVGPLAGYWKPLLEEPMTAAAGKGLIVDCRSSTYAAAWTPSGQFAQRWVQIKVPGATHMAKHTRGLVARAICELGLDPRRPHGLADALADRFEVSLEEPAKPGKPWILSATARG